MGRTRGGEGLDHHGRLVGVSLLGHRHEWYLVPRHQMARSGVWGRGTPKGRFRDARRLVLDRLVVGDEETVMTKESSNVRPLIGALVARRKPFV